MFPQIFFFLNKMCLEKRGQGTCLKLSDFPRALGQNQPKSTEVLHLRNGEYPNSFLISNNSCIVSQSAFFFSRICLSLGMTIHTLHQLLKLSLESTQNSTSETGETIPSFIFILIFTFYITHTQKYETPFGGSNFHVSREAPAHLCCLSLEGLYTPWKTPKAQV